MPKHDSSFPNPVRSKRTTSELPIIRSPSTKSITPDGNPHCRTPSSRVAACCRRVSIGTYKNERPTASPWEHVSLPSTCVVIVVVIVVDTVDGMVMEAEDD